MGTDDSAEDGRLDDLSAVIPHRLCAPADDESVGAIRGEEWAEIGASGFANSRRPERTSAGAACSGIGMRHAPPPKVVR